jgi:hypothetical protein
MATPFTPEEDKEMLGYIQDRVNSAGGTEILSGLSV